MRWLDASTVYALGLALIASIYIGFAVADGRSRVIAVETGVATIFVVVAAAAVTGSPWLLVLGLAGHGFKDLAAPPSLRRQHEVVAAVLPRRRFHGSSAHRRRHRRRLSPLTGEMRNEKRVPDRHHWSRRCRRE
jgi:hypothetical protein